MALYNKQICRTCMSEVKENALLHFIYDIASDKEPTTIAGLLMRTVPRLDIKLNDELPKSICLQCRNLLLKVADFQKMSLESQKVMKAMEVRAESEATVTDDVQSEPEERDEKNFIVQHPSNNCCETKTNERDGTQDLSNLKVEEVNVKDEMEEFIEELPNYVNLNDRFESEHTKSAGDNREDSTYVKEKNIELDSRAENESKIIDPIQSPEKMDDTAELSPANVQSENVRRSTRNSSGKKKKEHRQKKDLVASKLFCKYCFKEFAARTRLLAHELRFHKKTKAKENLSKGYECSICPKVLSSTNALYYHMKTHTDTKDYICDICDGAFTRSYDLKRHKNTHNNERAYQCDHCEKRFKHLADLKVHVRRHTGNTTIKCKYCLQSFVHHDDLKTHLKQFLGENIYRCELCPKRFPFAKDVREHFATHKNEHKVTREKNLAALKAEEDKLVKTHKKRKRNPKETHFSCK